MWRAAALSSCLSAQSMTADSPPWVLETTIPLEHTNGRIDHMAVDLRRHRLFVAELGNSSLDVVDLAAGKVTART